MVTLPTVRQGQGVPRGRGRLIGSHTGLNLLSALPPAAKLRLYILMYICIYLDMPNVSTYVSDEDFAKYLAIKNKGRGAWSQHVSDSLSNVKPTVMKSKDTFTDLQKELDVRYTNPEDSA